MRILIANVHFAPNSFGGATIVVEETARRLHERGHEVYVFTATSDTHVDHHQLFRYEQWGIPVVAVRPGSFVTEGTVYRDEGIGLQFGRLLEVVRPDVVHLHAIQTLGVAIAETAQKKGIPTVVTLHDAWWLCQRQFMIRETGEPCGQLSIKASVCSTCVPDPEFHADRQARSLRILNRCQAVLTPSHFWRERMVASGVAADRVHVNHNGVRRPAVGWRKPAHRVAPRLGYVGGVGPAKGSHHVIAALQSLQRSDYELRVVDSALNLGRVSMTAADWPIPGQLTIVPGYSTATIDDFFGSIDALLFPSQALETYGLTVREAAVRGVWPILPDGGGPVEHIHTGRNGTVYSREGGVESLAAAIDHYLREYRHLEPDVDANRRIPGFDEQVDDLLGHYSRVMEPGTLELDSQAQPPSSARS